jgi:hypothetical protein
VVKKFLLSLIVSIVSFTAFAQNIRLSGKVINPKNEPISGATIAVEGTTISLAASVDGTFSLPLEPGRKYTVVVSSAGYTTKSIDDVEVGNQRDNNLTIVLDNATEMSTVIVRTSVRRESTSALINFQKNNTAVSSGIAADFIRRTPDRNTGEILKRVSGTSIQDNKYVIVRGLGDRYNTAFLNGAQLPSSEPDKKAFSFDVIPSSVVDNIIINKTATPDLTGEFAGGLVQVTTRDVPVKSFLTVGATIGFNTESTGKDFVSNKRTDTDWLGFDDGTRKLPQGFPLTRQEYNGLSNQADGLSQKLALTRSFNTDVYATEQSTAAPLQTYNIAWGVGKKLKNDASFGSVISVLYRKSMIKYSDYFRALYDDEGVSQLQLNDVQNRYNINWGAMANFAYVKGKHKISFKNLFNRYYEDNYYTRTGFNLERNGDVQLSSSVLSERTFYTGIFEGNHQFSWKDIRVYWNAGYSLNSKSQPDLRTSAYLKASGVSSDYEWDADDTRRFYSDLRDHGVSGNIAVTIPFNAFDEKQSLKVGGSGLVRFRDFNSRIFRYIEASGNFDSELSRLPADAIFRQDNISPTGFVMEEFTNNQDKYFGVSALNAGYVMFDNKFGEKFRLIWGARAEFFEQFLHTKDLSAKRIVINKEEWNILPSANLTFSINSKNIIRLSASQTVSRPEFREIAPFQFFDYESTFGVRGNTDLKTTDIYNIDARYEIYPAPGEGITLGGFYKRFVNPIEFRLDPGSVLTRRNYFFQNAKDANTYGVEFEARKNLNFLGGSATDLLSNFSIFANLTYIFSQVSFNDELLGKVVSADRPVQGQSPYLINGGLQYSSTKTGWNGTLLYNRVGNRLTLVGYGSLGFPDVYENPRDVIDFQISKRILKRKGEIKLSFGDILNQKFVYYENVDDERAYDKSVDRVFSSFTPGSTISLGFSYDFSL